MFGDLLEDLGLPAPGIALGVSGGSHAELTGRSMIACEAAWREARPDLVVVAGGNQGSGNAFGARPPGGRGADPAGATLGQAAGTSSRLDANAAGWGWFVDVTPWEDSEHATPGNQGEQGRMDLFSVLAHEIGHLLDFEHADEGVMLETLAAGVRKLPTAERATDSLDGVFAAAAYEERWFLYELFRTVSESTPPARQSRR